jgi:cobalamin biosynthesis Mg chelatase CobN
MKYNTIIRVQLMLVAMVAAMFLASSAYAQQDMDPTSFPDGPYVTNFSQASQTDVNAKASNTFSMDATNSAAQAAASADEVALEEAGLAQWTSADTWSVTLLMMALALLVVYGAMYTKRERKIAFGPRTLTPSNVTVR